MYQNKIKKQSFSTFFFFYLLIFTFFLINTTNTQAIPTFSDFNFQVINGSKDVIGDNLSYNITNIEIIEYLNLSFTINDSDNVTGNISIFFVANGTNACSLGNNQSSTCYAYPNFIEWNNATDTDTFVTSLGQNSGDSITCSYSTVGDTFRNYTCEIDEHYNPNVWKHYPLNFSDVKWQDTANDRIRFNNIWKINISNSSVPSDADYYKLDFRVNYTGTPTSPIQAFICNTTYVTGDPKTSFGCTLVASKNFDELQDDGTKFRGIFTNNLTQNFDLESVIILSDTDATNYYFMKTYGFLGSGGSVVSISNNNGISYNDLTDGYETELNINWIYNDSGGNDPTQFVYKVQSNNSLGILTNSTEQTLTWLFDVLNEPPLISLITPIPSASVSGVIDINWTGNDPNGDNVEFNVTISNSSNTTVLFSDLPSSNTSVSWNTSVFGDGNYDVTVFVFENDTSDLFVRNSTHTVTIDNFPEPVVVDTETLLFSFIIPEVCGDLVCTSGESCSTCSVDCGICPAGGGSGIAGFGQTFDIVVNPSSSEFDYVGFTIFGSFNVHNPNNNFVSFRVFVDDLSHDFLEDKILLRTFSFGEENFLAPNQTIQVGYFVIGDVFQGIPEDVSSVDFSFRAESSTDVEFHHVTVVLPATTFEKLVVLSMIDVLSVDEEFCVGDNCLPISFDVRLYHLLLFALFITFLWVWFWRGNFWLFFIGRRRKKKDKANS